MLRLEKQQDMYFYDWLQKYADFPTPMGELARQVSDDIHFPRVSNHFPALYERIKGTSRESLFLSSWRVFSQSTLRPERDEVRSFYDWVMRFSDVDLSVGELARHIARDDEFPAETSEYEDLHAHVSTQEYFPNSTVCFKNAYKYYLKDTTDNQM